MTRGAKDRRQQSLIDELESGLAVLLLEIAVQMRAELLEREEWPADTVGDVLWRIIDSAGVSLEAPSTPEELADFRTALSGAARSMGKGRGFL